jgi:hypothetical protein
MADANEDLKDFEDAQQLQFSMGLPIKEVTKYPPCQRLSIDHPC